MRFSPEEVMMAENGDKFAIVFPVSGAGHWAWYVIDDETQTLTASGSDETEAAAIANAKKALM